MAGMESTERAPGTAESQEGHGACDGAAPDPGAPQQPDAPATGRAAATGMPSAAKLAAFAVAAVAILALACAFGWDDLLFGADALAALQAAAAAHPALAALAYLALALAGSVALALPGVVFALAAGTVFGAFWGTVLCWLAVTLGACLSFLIGRFFLKDSLKPKLARSRALNELLFEGAGRRDVYLLAITRLVPVFPYNLQNFAYGITDVRFVPYAVYSALFLLPGTAVYTVAAAGVVDGENRLACLALAAALLAATLVAAWALKRKAGLSS